MSNLAVFGGLSDACIKFYPKLEFPFAGEGVEVESILLQNRSLFYPSPSTLSKNDKSDKRFSSTCKETLHHRGIFCGTNQSLNCLNSIDLPWRVCAVLCISRYDKRILLCYSCKFSLIDRCTIAPLPYMVKHLVNFQWVYEILPYNLYIYGKLWDACLHKVGGGGGYRTRGTKGAAFYTGIRLHLIQFFKNFFLKLGQAIPHQLWSVLTYMWYCESLVIIVWKKQSLLRINQGRVKDRLA